MHNRKLLIGSILGTFLVASTVIALPLVKRNVRIILTTVVARLTPSTYSPFPAVDSEGLSLGQLKVINLARAEYLARPVSYDSRVLKYTQGKKEAWCADFISWVMDQTGNSLVNPNSGGWRTPGVYTLRDYYNSNGRYVEAGKYQPKPGDVAFYIGKHTFDLLSTEHAALVVQVNGSKITTIGGNEGGRLRLDTQIITAGENSLVGFGKL